MTLPLQLDLLGPQTLPLLLITAGLLISLAEAIAPGANLVVVGVALLGAGLVGLVLGPLASPVLLALLTLVIGALTFYGYRELDLYGGKGQQQTRDSRSLRGATGHVTQRVTATSGEVKLDRGGFNPYYSARSMDGEISVGTQVMVLDPGGGNVLTVDSIEEVEDEIDRELARGRTARRNGSESHPDSEREPERQNER